ncbi:MAG TPA: STAS domain-containing protein [Candidatus Ozemobacteraceae bacterium]|nr:STAS domain-containing protein [Candidatus Ozemobacteraceae bacterium]
MNTTEFSLRSENRGAVTLIYTHGPLNEAAGAAILRLVQEKLDQGVTRFVIDFGLAVSITSPCVASILEIAEKIVDEKSGRLVFAGLTDLNLKVFEMVGILLYAESCRNVQEAEVQALM